MRLINIRTLRFKEFFGYEIPKYAILSHRWEDEEVTFDEWLNPRVAKKKKGYMKIRNACRFILGLHSPNIIEYVWIDTCCIDKRSSAELSEAINSMFQWYRNSEICLVYLSDVDSLRLLQEPSTRRRKLSKAPADEIQDQFLHSLWFTRGWTLQELLAPRDILYLAKDWESLGDQNYLLSDISKASGIPVEYLAKQKSLDAASIAEKMIWASRRKTTRVEDTAYCLMGIFNINMPLLYGEGYKAFLRLQAEIIKESNDHSIFAWDFQGLDSDSVFAPSPQHFRVLPTAVPTSDIEIGTHHYYLTNNGLRMTLPIFQTADQDLHIAILNASFSAAMVTDRLCLIVKGLGPPRYQIVGPIVVQIPGLGLWQMPKKKMYLLNRADEDKDDWNLHFERSSDRMWAGYDPSQNRFAFLAYEWENQLFSVDMAWRPSWIPVENTMGLVRLSRTNHPSGTYIRTLKLTGAVSKDELWVAVSFNEGHGWSVSAFEGRPPNAQSEEDMVGYLEQKTLRLTMMTFNVQYPVWPKGLEFIDEDCPLILVSINQRTRHGS